MKRNVQPSHGTWMSEVTCDAQTRGDKVIRVAEPEKLISSFAETSSNQTAGIGSNWACEATDFGSLAFEVLKHATETVLARSSNLRTEVRTWSFVRIRLPQLTHGCGILLDLSAVWHVPFMEAKDRENFDLLLGYR